MLSNTEVWIYMISIIIVFLFAVTYSLYLILAPKTNMFFRMIAIIVFILSIYLGMNKSLYLPFLGYAALPPNLFEKEIVPKGASQTVTINLNNTPNDTRIIYWAATSSKDKDVIQPDPMQAYGDYSNTGVTLVKDNKAILYFNCPDRYQVGPFKKVLNRHIHYRLIYPNSPILSPVYTQYVKC